MIVRTPEQDGYITRMHARLVDRAGARVSIRSVMLHHVVFLNRGRFAGDREPKCGARFGEAFYGTGEENQSLDLPPGYGYRTRPKDRWKMQTMLMSHTPLGAARLGPVHDEDHRPAAGAGDARTGCA